MKRLLKLSALVSLISGALSFAQQLPTIAVYSFQDIGNSGNQQVGQKLYDRMLSHLIDAHAFEVYDRQYLEKVWFNGPQTAGRPLDLNAAIQAGRMGNVAAIAAGTITSFTFNPSSSNDKWAVYGTVTVAATARLISTDSGAYISSTTATQSARGATQMKQQQPPQQNCHQAGFRGFGVVCTTPDAPAAPAIETKTMEQLLDEAIEGCAKALAAALINSARDVPAVHAVPVPPPPPGARASTSQPGPTLPGPTVMSVTQGIVQINQGSSAGLKVGQALRVGRIGNLPFADPTTGKPMTGKVPVCTLTLGEVLADYSRGFCSGGVAQPGDFAEVR